LHPQGKEQTKPPQNYIEIHRLTHRDE